MVDIGENSLNGYERNCLFRNNADGTFTDVAHVNGADRVEDGRSAVVVDFDRDGRSDLLVRNYRQPAQLLHGVARAGATSGSSASGRAAAGERACARARPCRVHADAAGAAHWLEVRLIGTRSNRDAVGARIVATTGALRQLREVTAGSGYLSNGSLVQHFGLGAATTIDRLEIRWPSGGTSELRDVAADQRIVVTEADDGGGS